jgi:uncharacterized membrane protein
MMRGYGGYGYGYGGPMMDGGWVGIVLMLLFAAVVIAGIALLVVWAMRSASRHGQVAGGVVPPASPAGHDEAIAIAKRRLAGGEITAEQYEEITRTLSS